MRDADDVTTVELKVAEAPVGQLRMRSRERTPDGALLRLVTTLIASEVERVRAPERASEEAATSFQRAVLAPPDRGPPTTCIARGKELGTDLVGRRQRGRRPRPRPQPDRGRLAPAAAGGRRSRRPLDRQRGDRRPDRDRRRRGRAAGPRRRRRDRAAACPRRCCASSRPASPGSPSRSGAAAGSQDPLDLQRAYNEALLALNVVEGDPERIELAYEETGTYQLLLPYMSDPAELKRFYDETVRPLVAYDEQYETDLLGTLATFLDCDANVNATASRLITHRHTIRYRFERVRELTGLDVSSTDGREKLSLGLKAMRVLGIAAPARAGHRARRGCRARAALASARAVASARSAAAAISSPAMSSGSVLRVARASTNAPSSAAIMAITSSRATSLTQARRR